MKAFLEWTHRNRLSGTFDITRGPQTGLTVTGLSTTERLRRLNRIIAPEFPTSPGVRLSAALILLFGIRPHQITGLCLADVIQRGGNTYLRLGPEPLQLPEDVAALTSAVFAERSARRTLTTVEDTEWLLPGSAPGYQCDPVDPSGRRQQRPLRVRHR